MLLDPGILHRWASDPADHPTRGDRTRLGESVGGEFPDGGYYLVGGRDDLLFQCVGEREGDAGGWSAARIEEELVVTADGCEVITKFPAEELLVAGQRYWTVGGPLDTLRDSQSHKNTAAGRGETRVTPPSPGD